MQTPSWHPLKIKANIMLIQKSLLILAAKYFGAYILHLLVNLVTFTVVYFFFPHPYPLALAVNKSPAVYILSRALDGLWRENRGSVNRLKKVFKFKSRDIKSLRQVPLCSSLVLLWGNVLNKYIWDTYQAVLLRSIFLPLPSAWLQQTWFLRPWPSTLNLRRTCEQKLKTRG